MKNSFLSNAAARDPFPRQPRRGGFTLIELLTVIAIIGILAAILIPVTQAVRASARTSTCLNQLRQAGTAIFLYAHDHEGSLPGFGAGAADRWIHRVSPYLDVVDDTPGSGAYAYNSPQFRCTNNEGLYGLNDLFMQPREAQYGINIDSIRSPSQTVMVAEKAPIGSVLGPTLHTFGSFPEARGGPAANHRSDGNPMKGGGPTNYLFSDGHVSTLQEWPGEDAFNPDL